MSRRSTEIQPANRRTVARPAGGRPQKEQLLDRQLALKDVALAQAEVAFDIERRQNLTMKNPVAKVRCEFTDRIDDRVAEGLALVIPRTAAEVVRRVLHETRHHVLARWCDRRIGQAGNDDV